MLHASNGACRHLLRATLEMKRRSRGVATSLRLDVEMAKMMVERMYECQ